MNNGSTGSDALIQAEAGSQAPSPRAAGAGAFAPRAALVTGASRGLGAALARELARRGAKVVLVARERAPLEAVADEITREGGVAHALAADVGDKGQTYAIAGAAAALVGPIDLLVHNASTLGKTPLPILLDTECEDLGRVLEVNVVGPFRLTKVIAGAMALRRRGVVVHISSDAAVNAYPRWGAYGVSKAALDHLSRTWAAELEGTGVSFYAVDPGEMDTRMHAEAIPDVDPSTLANPADVARRIVGLVARAGEVPSGARLEAASLPEAP
ncbi:SDR family NAD(P)-dependent oxidoreductase [Sorangium sp. So ce1335]|uniref:SDR family NAD(P)-dependent oxidoreductase n=1 Tax=Sorangium sp. So ce1335 TaxID=3133335 RepID=UPI003F647321